MNIFPATLVVFIVSVVIGLRHAVRLRHVRDRERLETLSTLGSDAHGRTSSDQFNSIPRLAYFSDRLGKANYITFAERRGITTKIMLCMLSAILCSTIYGFTLQGTLGALVGLSLTSYLALLCALYFLRWKSQDVEREVLFQTPLVLESLILLVESGAGILPALGALSESYRQRRSSNPVLRFLDFVYQLSTRGIPFADALQQASKLTQVRVLRHVLLHLDVSGSEGGSVVPSLRSLAEHAHTEWRLSVEQRVKRLENMVVFPVFASVMGLLILTASVPMVPLLELKDTMAKRAALAKQSISPQHGVLYVSQ